MEVTNKLLQLNVLKRATFPKTLPDEISDETKFEVVIDDALIFEDVKFVE
jgi:hypothetical protein